MASLECVLIRVPGNLITRHTRAKRSSSQRERWWANRSECLQPFPTTNCILSGSQAEEILQEYLKSKESVTDAILQTDQTLSEKEKLIEGEELVKRLDSSESS